MQKISVLLAMTCFLCLCSFAQTTTLNYTTAGWPAPNTCNIFNFSPIRSLNGLNHWPVSGGASYSSGAVSLQTQGNSTQSNIRGTAYAIEKQIKPGYSYTITVNA